MLEGKIGKGPFFRVQSDDLIVWGGYYSMSEEILRRQDEMGRRSKKVKPWLTGNQILIGCKIQQIETLIRNSIHIQQQRLAIGILDVCIRCEKGSFSIFVTLH